MNFASKSISFLCFGFLCAFACKLQAGNCAIYLTTGIEAHEGEDVAWGGCHITLTGFHKKHGEKDLINKIPQIIKDTCPTGERWRPKNLCVKKWGSHWTIVFYSKTLNKIAKELDRAGFRRIKGPEFCKSPFHMVLPQLKERQDAEAFANQLKTKEWYVTLVEMADSKRAVHGAGWKKYFPLTVSDLGKDAGGSVQLHQFFKF